MRMVVACWVAGITAGVARADVAPPGSESDSTLLRIALLGLSAPFLFGLLILAAARIHQKRSQSENAQ